MARTREFDTEAAVSRAMELFWAREYEATSVRDLTRHLAIGQDSLYAAFGDEDGLCLAALEHYRTTFATAALRSFEEGADARSSCARCWSSGSDQHTLAAFLNGLLVISKITRDATPSNLS